MEDIKDYLHLYIGQRCVIKFRNKEEGYSAPVTLSVECYRSAMVHELHRDHIKVLLLLRPLSDMTKAENVEIFQVGESDWRQRHLEFTSEQFVKLLSKGFDLFGLIEAGFAIDKTTLKQTV